MRPSLLTAVLLSIAPALPCPAQVSLGPVECAAEQSGIPGPNSVFARWTNVDYTGPSVRAHCGEYYNLFVPQGPAPAAGWPLLVFLDFGSFRRSTRREFLDPDSTADSRADLAYLAVTHPTHPMAVMYASCTVSRGGPTGLDEYDPVYDPWIFGAPEYGDAYPGNGVFIAPGILPAGYTGPGEPYTDTERPMPEKDVVMIVQHVKFHADALPPDAPDPIRIDPSRVVYYGNSGGATTLSWVVLGPDRSQATFPHPDPGSQEEMSTRVEHAILDNGSIYFRRFKQSVEIEGLPAGIHLPTAPVNLAGQFYDDPARHLGNVPDPAYQDQASALVYGWDGPAGPVTQLNRQLRLYVSARIPTSEPTPVCFDLDPLTGGPGPCLFATDIDAVLHPSWHAHVWKLLYPQTMLVTTLSAAYTHDGQHPASATAAGLIPDKVLPDDLSHLDLSEDEMAWIVDVLEQPTGSWTDLGHALAGVAGEPELVGSGTLQGGAPATLVLSQAAPSSYSVLVAGLAHIDVPFLYGIMVPRPDLLIVSPTKAIGGKLYAATWPEILQGGLQVYLQQWTIDAAAPFGASASNALRATTP